jgi:hydrogenase expression/formation protein HypD
MASEDTEATPLTGCISHLVLRGVRLPCDCPAFGRACTPGTPLGETMASEDGMCAAYYQYARSVPSDAAE